MSVANTSKSVLPYASTGVADVHVPLSRQPGVAVESVLPSKTNEYVCAVKSNRKSRRCHTFRVKVPTTGKPTLINWMALVAGIVPFGVMASACVPDLTMRVCTKSKDEAALNTPQPFCPAMAPSVYVGVFSGERARLARGTATDVCASRRFVDMNDALCATATCATTRNGLVLFTDDDHLTATFTRSVGSVLGDRISLALGEAPR